MVSFTNGECGSETVYKRRRTNGASPPTDALTPVQQRQTARYRKQTLMSKLSDSGFEEDLGPSPISSSAQTDVVSPLRSDEPPAWQLSTWYLQYGDIGYKIQKEKEAQFHPCKSLARQPQVGYKSRYSVLGQTLNITSYWMETIEIRIYACTVYLLAYFPVFQNSSIHCIVSQKRLYSFHHISQYLCICCQ